MKTSSKLCSIALAGTLLVSSSSLLCNQETERRGIKISSLKAEFATAKQQAEKEMAAAQAAAEQKLTAFETEINQQAPGILALLKTALKNTVTDPLFWSSEVVIAALAYAYHKDLKNKEANLANSTPQTAKHSFHHESNAALIGLPLLHFTITLYQAWSQAHHS